MRSAVFVYFLSFIIWKNSILQMEVSSPQGWFSKWHCTYLLTNTNSNWLKQYDRLCQLQFSSLHIFFFLTLSRIHSRFRLLPVHPVRAWRTSPTGLLHSQWLQADQTEPRQDRRLWCRSTTHSICLPEVYRLTTLRAVQAAARPAHLSSGGDAA